MDIDFDESHEMGEVSARAKALLKKTEKAISRQVAISKRYKEISLKGERIETTSVVLDGSCDPEKPHTITLIKKTTPDKGRGKITTVTLIRENLVKVEADHIRPYDDVNHLEQGVEWTIEKRFLRPDKVTVRGWDNKTGTKQRYPGSYPNFLYHHLTDISDIEAIDKSIIGELPKLNPAVPVATPPKAA